MEENKDWRDRLDQSESPMDTSKFWKSLEHKIPAEPTGKKRRRFLIWLFLFLISAGIAGSYIMQSNFESKKSQETPGEITDQNISKSEDSKSQHFQAQSRKPEVQMQESNDISLVPEKQKFNPDRTSNDPSIENTFNHSERNSGRKSQETVSSFPGQKLTPSPAGLSFNFNPEIPANGLKSNAGSINADEKLTNNEPTNIEWSNPDKIAKSLNKLPILQSELLNETNWHLNFVPEFEQLPKIKPKKKSWQYWMDLSYGLGLARHQYEADNASVQNYLEHRLQFDRPLESRLAFWENRLIHPSGFYISTGLRYQSHVTRFDWSKEETKMEWKLTDGFVQDVQGNPIAVRDSAWQTYREHREVRHHNTISTLDIPLNLGYIMRNKEFSLEFAAGITANIAQYTSGKQLDQQHQIMNWNSTPELTFNKFNTGWGVSGMARVSWYPTDFLGIFLQPSVHKDLSNRMPAEAGYRHRIDAIHIQAGISCKLFGAD